MIRIFAFRPITYALALTAFGSIGCARGEPAALDRTVAQVRVVEARRSPMALDVVLTGDIQAQAQVNVSFRTNGKVAERRVEVGDHVEADQVLASLEPLTQRANLDNAKAALNSAEALLTQAKMSFERQKQLLSGGFTTRSTYDNAEQELRTTQAAVDSAKAALGTAQEQFSYTELRAGVAGIVTSRSFEVGQVVQSGQTVLVVAQDGPRDAVFNVYESLTTQPPDGDAVAVALQADPSVATTGTVREISPTVDASSGTVRVKIGLRSTPAAMGLGAVVVGRGRFAPHSAVELPWSALYRYDGRPSVWIYDPARRTVSVRAVEIDRFGPDIIAIRQGVEPGERAVVAGIQFLRPGQIVAATELGDRP
ncbi:efflux RND transporter periplasmic adaptor subunit [Methylobacterium mesophilicum SR1.6/6]|uniref:Efflux RND transporter periplasmic adaptor subunit n=1 Tax=Methylobacterium mesophilicum SR1.6/6 TaxID=908290 RepID=A0A6B9FJX2_9HYPH|nr:efflux RND transporter periplasmic adaptor subunit [Methylobacterium mesophilicum]QGY02833.1 efflux RND transporter periplasmic adaptor subunit [Methylobacterium mesophilicum SR1.6/6]